MGQSRSHWPSIFFFCFYDFLLEQSLDARWFSTDAWIWWVGWLRIKYFVFVAPAKTQLLPMPKLFITRKSANQPTNKGMKVSQKILQLPISSDYNLIQKAVLYLCLKPTICLKCNNPRNASESAGGQCPTKPISHVACRVSAANVVTAQYLSHPQRYVMSKDKRWKTSWESRSKMGARGGYL